MSREAMKMALEAIQIMKAGHCVEEQIYMNKTIAALESELAKPEQEPVGWVYQGTFDKAFHSCDSDGIGAIPVYFSPPRKEWVSLTDEDMRMLVDQARKVPTEIPCQDHNERLLTLADAKLKELNG